MHNFIRCLGAVFLLIFSTYAVFSQSIESVQRELRKKNKPKKAYPDFFGFQYRPIIPMNAFGAGPVSINGKDDIHNSVVSQNFGFSAGGVLRVGFSPRLAIETGINFTRRNYQTDYAVPDSSLTATTHLRNVSYDIPVNLLIYVKINEQLFINTSFGNSFVFFRSIKLSNKAIDS